MIIDLENEEVIPKPADVCIVGAGAAGITLAVELSRQGKRVLLLESGGLRDEARTQELYRSELAGLNHTGIHEGRHRVHGGTTTRWGGQILELFDDDFEERPWIKGSGWPISKRHLRPYYERALALEGLQDAETSDSAVWKKVGLGTPDLGLDLRPFFSRWCREPNFARLHGTVLAEEANLKVHLHANACEILFAEDGETISGIRCSALSGRKAIFTAGQYVLCLGGIETSRFLLQPHADGRASWHRNPLLGKFFQDHLDVYCATLTDIHPHFFHAHFDHVCRQGYRYEPRFRLSADQQEKDGLLNVAGMVFFEDPPDAARHRVWQTMKLLVKGRTRDVTSEEFNLLVRNLPTLARQMYRYQVDGRSYNPSGLVNFRLRAFCEQEPLGESRISLSSEKDALGHYRAKLEWRISERELMSIRRFVEVVRAAFAEKNIARVVPDPDLVGDPSAFIPRIMDSYHHMGGARMGKTPSDGLVDPELKVHQTRNLYVCSSAVFPTSGFSNPTHTLLALAVRLADHLKTA